MAKKLARTVHVVPAREKLLPHSSFQFDSLTGIGTPAKGVLSFGEQLRALNFILGATTASK